MVRILFLTWIVACCVAVRPDVAAAQSATAKKTGAKKTADRDAVPGYKYREILGFRLLVNNKVLEEDANWTGRRRPLEVLEMEFSMLIRDLPPRAIAVLRMIPIWVEWARQEHILEKRPGVAVACYHPGNKLNQRVGYRFDTLEEAVKSNCVEILTMKTLTECHQGDRQDYCVLLHEFTHAVHHHLFDFDNPVIKAAYAHAMAQDLYEDKYAATNEKEYFAEISCAYFDHLFYRPETRDDLKTYDPVGYHMMELTWGTPEQIQREKKPEREKNAAAGLASARRLLRNKQRQDQAKEALQAVIDEYPKTRAAAEAAKLLDKL
jgi:hypothetical protein